MSFGFQSAVASDVFSDSKKKVSQIMAMAYGYYSNSNGSTCLPPSEIYCHLSYWKYNKLRIR